MDQSYRRNYQNGVNGRRTNRASVAPGQEDHVRQVAPDRHQATVGDGYVRRQVISHVTATASQRSSLKRRCGTWNVRSLIREAKIENVAQEAGRLNLDILGVADI